MKALIFVALAILVVASAETALEALKGDDPLTEGTCLKPCSASTQCTSVCTYCNPTYHKCMYPPSTGQHSGGQQGGHSGGGQQGGQQSGQYNGYTGDSGYAGYSGGGYSGGGYSGGGYSGGGSGGGYSQEPSIKDDQ